MNPTPTELDETAAALQASDKMAEYLALTEMLVRTNPTRADIHLHRARALIFGSNRREEALEEVQLAAGLVTEDAADLMRLAAVLLTLGELDRVDEYIQRAATSAGLRDTKDDPSLAYLAGMAAAAIGEDERAVELLEAAVRGQPQDPDYARDLARLCIKRGDTGRARTVAADALRASPQDERLRRIAQPVPAEIHGDQWLAAVTHALNVGTSGLRCPVHNDGELVWERVPATRPTADRHRLYCPMCGADVVVDVDSDTAAASE